MNHRFHLIATMMVCGILLNPSFSTFAGEPEILSVWPSKPPGETKEFPEEMEVTQGGPKIVAGKPIYLLTNVSKPELAVYRPNREHNTGMSVVICPGGGHNLLAYDLEGTEIAQWLNSLGHTGIVLKYRVPFRNPDFKGLAALQDAQRAISVVRARSIELGIEANKIGIMGFSAGGEVAARASLQYNARKYEKIDSVDETSCRPDFSMLIYPAYLVKENALLEELKPAADAPPAFMVHAWDDNVTPLSSLCLATELKKVGVSTELHLFALGGHGYGMRHVEGMPVTDWTSQAAPWLSKFASKK
jgi:acetyl esterase/lipase